VEITDAELVDSLRLAEGNYLKRAAVLVFHEDPERWVIGSYVKIGYFQTGADLLFMDEVHGPLLTMADKVLDILYAKYFRGMISYQGLQRVETYPVARAALREAILNAIVHRDYSTGVPIQIKVFPDRLTIFSDGGLPPGWTVEKLLGHHDSSPRNPNIANVFFRSGQIETWGRGIEKIEESSRTAYKPSPVFEITPTEVTITFPYGATVPATVSSPRGDDNGDDVAMNENTEKLLSAIIAAPSSTHAQLSEATGLSARTVSREIKRLRDTGVIRRVGSDRKGQWTVDDSPTE